MSVTDPTCRERPRIGGSELLLTFLEKGARLSASRVDVIAPYVDDAAFIDGALHRAWQRVVTSAQTTIVVRTAESAQAVWRSLPEATTRCRVLLNCRVHAKLFVARAATGWVALAGSMNLTGAAFTISAELGVLFTGTAPDSVVRSIGERFEEIARNGRSKSVARRIEPRSRREDGRVQTILGHATSVRDTISRPWHR